MTKRWCGAEKCRQGAQKGNVGVWLIVVIFAYIFRVHAQCTWPHARTGGALRD